MSDVLAERIEAAWRRLRQSHWDRAHHDNDETVAEAFAAADAVLREHAHEVWWCDLDQEVVYGTYAGNDDGDCMNCMSTPNASRGCGPRLVVDPDWLARGGGDAD